MASPLLSRDEAKERLGNVVQAVESRSCAEVVISVRPWAQSWAGVDFGLAAAVAYTTLLYMLFAPQVFGLLWIALITPTAFGAGVMAARSVPGLRAALAGGPRLEEAVKRAAEARFVELGVTATRERSGILVYVGLTERRCKVVADVGVHARVPKDEWKKAAETVESSIAKHGVGAEGLAALCKAVEALGDVLEGPMPRAADDINELEDVA